MPRPQRGSRKMLMFGVQKVTPWYCFTNPVCRAWSYFTRASSLTAVKTS